MAHNARKHRTVDGSGWRPTQLLAQDPSLDVEMWEGMIGVQVIFAVFPEGDWETGGQFFEEELHAERAYDRVSGGGLHLAGIASAAADMDDPAEVS